MAPSIDQWGSDVATQEQEMWYLQDYQVKIKQYKIDEKESECSHHTKDQQAAI